MYQSKHIDENDLLELLQFIHRNQFLYAQLNVEFFSAKIYECIDKEWLKFMTNLSWPQLNRLPIDFAEYQDCPTSLAEFFSQAISNSLANKFSTKFQTNFSNTASKFRRVKPKKAHELAAMVQFIEMECKKADIDRIVDIGCGLGHLGRYLKSNDAEWASKIEYVGIEANPEFCHSGQKIDSDIKFKNICFSDENIEQCRKIFIEKFLLGLSNVWCSLAEQSGQNHNNMGHNNGSSNQIKSQTGATIGTTVVGLEPEVHASFVERMAAAESTVRNERFELRQFHRTAIVSLHGCGELQRLILTEFAQIANAQTNPLLIIIGCCYHKVKDWENTAIERWMLSKRMLEMFKQIFGDSGFPIPGLRLACQAKLPRWTIFTEEEHRRHKRAFSNRAFVECLKHEMEYGNNWSTGRPRKLNRQLGTGDTEFREEVLRRSGGTDYSPERRQQCGQMLDAIIDAHSHAIPFIEPFTCLQFALQAPLESFILLDRLFFLAEQGFNAELVELFDPLLSPRNTCIVGRIGGGIDEQTK